MGATMTDSYDSHDETLLADAYDDLLDILTALDKHILRERYAIVDGDPLIATRWAIARWIESYDKAEALDYGGYLWLVAQAQGYLYNGDSNIMENGEYGF